MEMLATLARLAAPDLTGHRAGLGSRETLEREVLLASKVPRDPRDVKGREAAMARGELLVTKGQRVSKEIKAERVMTVPKAPEGLMENVVTTENREEKALQALEEVPASKVMRVTKESKEEQDREEIREQRDRRELWEIKGLLVMRARMDRKVDADPPEIPAIKAHRVKMGKQVPRASRDPREHQVTMDSAVRMGTKETAA